MQMFFGKGVFLLKENNNDSKRNTIINDATSKALKNKLIMSLSILIGLAILLYFVLANLVIIVNSNLSQDHSKWHFIPFTSYNNLKEISNLIEYNEYKITGLEVTDGLGRKLEPSSWFIRYVFGSNKLSAGLGWQFFDWILILIAVGIAVVIYPKRNK